MPPITPDHPTPDDHREIPSSLHARAKVPDSLPSDVGNQPTDHVPGTLDLHGAKDGARICLPLPVIRMVLDSEDRRGTDLFVSLNGVDRLTLSVKEPYAEVMRLWAHEVEEIQARGRGY